VGFANRIGRVALAVGALLLLGSSTASLADARDVAGLRVGVFLYAAPSLTDPNFSQAVVLLVEHGSQGAIGLIVNRPTEATVEATLPDAAFSGLRIYQGGPVQPAAVLALVRTERPPEGAVRILEDVFMTGRLRDLAAATRGGRAGERVRIYSGYAGWGAGQLEKEIRTGAWVIGPAEVAALFSPEPETLWRKVYRLLRRTDA